MEHKPVNTAEQKDMTEFFIDLITKLEEMSPDLVCSSVVVCFLKRTGLMFRLSFLSEENRKEVFLWRYVK